MSTSTSTSTPWRWAIVGAAGALLVGLVAGPVLAGAMAPRTSAPVNGATDTPPEHTISVAGSGKVAVVPDIATVRLGVVIERNTAKAAREAAAESMTRIVAALRKLGIEDKDIATANVSLSPVYSYPANQAPRIRGYQLNNMVTVTVRDLDALSDVLDNGIQSGATAVDGVSFDVADRAGVRGEGPRGGRRRREGQGRGARQGRGRDHLRRREHLRAGLHAGLVRGARLCRGPAGDGAAETPVLPGTTDVVITVQVTFLIP